jgi:hypothetical protein
LPDDEAAWRVATRFAGDLVKDVDGALRPGSEWALQVTDGDRKPIFEIQIVTKTLRLDASD